MTKYELIGFVIALYIGLSTASTDILGCIRMVIALYIGLSTRYTVHTYHYAFPSCYRPLYRAFYNKI